MRSVFDKQIAAPRFFSVTLQTSTIRYTGGDRGWIGDVPEFRYNLSKVNSLGWQAAYTSNEAVRLAIQKALGK